MSIFNFVREFKGLYQAISSHIHLLDFAHFILGTSYTALHRGRKVLCPWRLREKGFVIAMMGL